MAFDWKDIAEKVGAFAPILGTLVAGPAGGAVGAMIASALGVANTPDAVHEALKVNPDAAVKLAQIEKDRQVELQQLVVTAENNRLAAETAAVGAVNATMQAEAKSEHWPTYTWRPFIGFCVGINTLAASLLVLAVFVPMMFGNAQATVAIAQLPTVLGALAAISGVVMPILGIASWFRGKAQADPANQTPARG